MIKCSDYDYIEIACLFHYPIKLTLKMGEAIEGIAQDTQRNQAKDECIVLDIQGDHQLIVLDTISAIDVLIENPHFRHVSFEP
ncbi:Rho-binding antiterminator [Enterovibrio sp. ZSDZ35]|uniref:Rho-binding antiterminator n=1 Tax=Enterovibrio qingdaonensis TaxID=2899818 RepID=A0ABT5QSU2_9GAMM|nr:Rho-binding antiterminator [Enterovibrio sp. ZSDZ35]MDD1783659.1 Rho-binding antiterminator [Enterovibrio sp. ZSDZ35]